MVPETRPFQKEDIKQNCKKSLVLKNSNTQVVAFELAAAIANPQDRVLTKFSHNKAAPFPSLNVEFATLDTRSCGRDGLQ